MAIDYSRGYTAGWRVRRVDPSTWLPGEELHGVDGASVSRSTGDESPLMESGELSLSGELEEGWYRIEALVSQDGNTTAEPIATLLFAPDGSEWSNRSWGGKATGRSVLAPADEKMMPRGSYAPKGSDGAAWCGRLLAECVPSPVHASGSFTLSSHVVFDLGSSALDAVWQMLDASGWCMQVDGEGEITIMAPPEDAALELTDATRSLLMPKFSKSLPMSDLPNVLRVYDGDKEAEAVNDDPASPTSTVSRGRRIEAVEENPTRANGETLQAYAKRRLSELSEIHETLDVEREYAPGVLPYSPALVRLPEAGIDGEYRVMSQKIECGAGVKVGETLGRRQRWS